MTTSNYDEIRRVRHEMSAAAGHDVHKLIAAINQLRDQHADKIIAPGKAEQCDARAFWKWFEDKREEPPPE